ncbi:LysR family transcriptional regulator [Chitinophaga sp.]|uniref:LysR family transcriptional regulator n=1 Tax=Chitinophaga sp. TaxID=1869181 RepID=UPI002F92EC54
MKEQYRVIIDWIVLIKVIENRSFSKSAKELNLSVSCVSKSIAKLEYIFRCQLIRRNAHNFEVTEVGKMFYDKAIEIYNVYYSLVTETANVNKQFNGIIRLTAPGILCDSLINLWAWEYMQKHPKVKIILNSRELGSFSGNSPEFDDLVIKSGFIDSPDIIHKKLDPVPFGLYASPDYLKHAAPLTHPQDINIHSVLKFEHHSLALPLTIRNDENSVEINFNERASFCSNNVNSILNLVLEGKGICIAIPEWIAEPHVEKGDLVNVLPGWRLPLLPCNIVWRYRNYYSVLFMDLISYIDGKWNDYFSK